MLGAVKLSSATLDPIIKEMGTKYNIEPALIRAVIKAESDWDVNASRYEVHKTDASWGLMQLMLETGRWILGNSSLTITQLTQPRVNIEAGTKYLRYNLDRFKDIKNAVAAYNAGSPRIDKKTGKLVNQSYVDKVTKNYELYKSIGETAGNIVAVATSEEAVPIYVLAGLAIVGAVVFSRLDE